LTAAREFDVKHPEGNSLEQFLEESSLVADTDAWETETDKVTLMTLHAAKGLEFPAIFIVACEEGLLPHDRSRHDDEKLEEERRLLFVGITRAKEELQISYANYRAFRGFNAPTVASSFLMELPRQEMDLSNTVTSRRTRPEFDESHQGEAADDFEEGDIEFDVSQLDAPPAKSTKPSPALTSGLVTGADLLAQNARPRVAPSRFKHGMVVEHPEYGPGTIIALSGEGAKRNAVVQFFGDQSQRTFRLAFSDLTPAE
jgi:DNA helicase-2/ATP-dependent DNA helicase PcrA